MGYKNSAKNVRLIWRKTDGGGYKHGVYLNADLALGGDQGWQAAEVRLDAHIGNDNGDLAFYTDGGDFSSTLVKVYLLDNDVLVAELKRPDGSTRLTQTWLDGAIGNDHGSFNWEFGVWHGTPRTADFDINTLSQHTQNSVS